MLAINNHVYISLLTCVVFEKRTLCPALFWKVRKKLPKSSLY